MVVGCIIFYSALFATGYFLFANYTHAITLSVVAIVTIIMLTKLIRLRKNSKAAKI